MKNSHYLDNKRFEELIHLYYKDPLTYGNELASNFDILVTNILHSFKFNVEEEDAKQDCMLLIFKMLSNFKPEDGTAFNYFTTVILNNLKLIYTKNKKYSEKINKFIDISKEKLES